MAVRYARLTALLATTAAVGIGAAEIAADLSAKSELRRIVATHPDLRVAAVHAEPFAGRLVLEGVEAGRGPSGHIAIGRLTLARAPIGLGLISSARAESALDSAVKALEAKPKAEPEPEEETTPGAEAPAAGGASSAIGSGVKTLAPPAQTGSAVPGTATAENVVYTKGARTVRIKKIDLTGTSLSNADLAKLIDANSGESLESRLRKVNATSIVVPEILVDDPTAGSEGHVVVSQVALSGVVAGKATAVTIGGVTLQAKTGENTTSGTVGAVQAFGVDFAQTAHVFGTVRKDDGEPILPLYDSATINGIKLSNGKDGAFSIASFKETGVKARPLKTDVLSASRPDQAKLSKAEQAALFKDMTQSFEIGSIEVTDIGLSGDDAKKPFGFKLSSFSMRGFGKSKFGGFSIHGIRFESPDIKMGLGSAEIGPFGLPQGDPASSATMMAAGGRADFDQIDIDVPQKDPSKAGERVKFKVAHTSFISEATSAGDIPSSMKMVIDNIAFDLPPKSADVKPLADMGYSHLDLSAGLVSTYDAGKQELSIRDLTLKGVDMGTVGIGLHFLNVTKGLVSQDKNVQKAAALAMLIKGVTVDVANDGLVDRAIEWKAKQDGVSVDAEKATIIEFFDKTLPAQFTSANVKIVGSAIAKFVAAPKKLHVGVISKSGFGAGSMALLSDPNLLIDTLEVTATAN